jgi:glucose-1-phosphate thymidylyltransferase
MIAHGVVLAAGRGTRLGSLVDDVPKPLLEVGGRPLIDRIIGALTHNGVTQLTIVTGYRADRLERHVAARWGDDVAFVRQEKPRGTAHALSLAHDMCGASRFALAWADIALSGKAYGSVVRGGHHDDDVVLGVNWIEDPSAGASVVFDGEGMVSAIQEKPVLPPPSHWNNAGIMVMGPTIWPHIDAVEPSARGELELTDALQALIDAGGRVRAVRLGGPWFDIGTPHGLEAARIAFD